MGVQNADTHRHWADWGRLQLVSDPWMWRICKGSVTVAGPGQSARPGGLSGDLLS